MNKKENDKLTNRVIDIFCGLLFITCGLVLTITIMYYSFTNGDNLQEYIQALPTEIIGIISLSLCGGLTALILMGLIICMFGWNLIKGGNK